MKRPPPRDRRPSVSELTLIARGAFLALALKLREKSQINHLNRTLITFQHDDGRKETYTVWPGDGSPEKHRDACDQLNWSEH